jgi:dephospho-CoA kinase
MIRVGVTGGIGSGKSTACKLFEELGIPVYYSDLRARELMNTKGEIKQAIIKLFGDDAYCDGVLDSVYIAGKVFSNSLLLESLNTIVHPAVALDFKEWARAFTDRPYVVLESAILYESGFDRFVDRVITVSAPEETRLERVLARGVGQSREDAAMRMANQMSDNEREARADHTIHNDGGVVELTAQVQQLDKELKQ